MTGIDAVEMLLAGATAVGVGTANFLDPRAAVPRARRTRRLVPRRTTSRACRISSVPWRNETIRCRNPRDHLVLVLDVDSLDDALADRAPARAVVRHREGRLPALRGRGPRPWKPCADNGFRGVRRPEAPRHPEHRRARRAQPRPARRELPELPRRRRCRHAARRHRGFARGRAPTRASTADLARGHRAHERARTSTRSTQRMQIARERGVRRCGVRGKRRRDSRAHRGCARWCPASVWRVATRTIRRASTRPATRSRSGADWLVIGRAVTEAEEPGESRRSRLRARVGRRRSGAPLADRLRRKCSCVY